MLSNVRELPLLKVRLILAVLWTLFLLSLLVDPLDLAQVGVAWDVRLFWTLIAAAPCFILVAGHEGWRRICPLSFLSQIPRYMGRQRAELFPKDSWMARHHLFVQFGLLTCGVVARAVFLNSDRWLLGLTLLAIISTAVFVGWRYAGKPWCQYFCPIAPVQKFFSGPSGLFESAPHRVLTTIPKSMCRTAQKSGPDQRACVGCRSDCADIDLELNHWRELFKPGQALVYYGYPGLLLGFFGFHAWRNDGLASVLNGAWTRRSAWVSTSMLDLAGALVIFGLSITASVAVLYQIERLWARRRKQAGVSYERARHEMFATSVILSFLAFYYFGQASFHWLIPVDYRALGFALVAGTGLVWTSRTWQRLPGDYQQEVLAQRLKKNLQRLLAAGSEPLRRVLGSRDPLQLQDREVYWVGKTLHAFSADNSVTLYQTLLKPLLHPPAPAEPPSDAELLKSLALMRANLGVSDEDHHIVLKRLRDAHGGGQGDRIPLEDTLKMALLARLDERYPDMGAQRNQVLQRLNLPIADSDTGTAPQVRFPMDLDLTLSDGRKTHKYRASVVKGTGSDVWVDVHALSESPPFKAGTLVSGYFVDPGEARTYRFISRLKRKHLDKPHRLLLQTPGDLRHAERRHCVRADYTFKATLTPLADDGLEDPDLLGEVVDLGAGGALFKLGAAYTCKDGQQMHVEFTLPDGKQMSCAARIVRVEALQLADQRRLQQVALQFDDLHDGDRSLLSRATFHALSRVLLERGQLGPGGWSKARLFRVAQVVDEGACVRSFYLKPRDGRPLPSFKPGQFLTFALGINAKGQVLRRCYSLSDAPRADYFRVSIKRVPPPKDQPTLAPGLSSSFFHQRVKPGALLEVMQPAGSFHLDPQDPRTVVLVGGGIGITPVLSMLNFLTQGGYRQPIHFFLGVRNGSEHIFKAHLQTLAAQYPQVRLSTCYSEPTGADTIGTDYQHQGRVTAELIKSSVGHLDCHFYLCGPSPFMSAISNGLVHCGAAQSDVRFEAFGPASVADASHAGVAIKADAHIHFVGADKVCTWNTNAKTLLELAEQGGLVLPFGCRAGNCHACAIEIRSGTVAYLKKAEPPPEPGMCLTCIAVPNTDVVLVDPA